MRNSIMEDRKEVCNMSNLGGYQRLTTIAKRVGGPKNLVLLIAGSGAVIYKGVETLVKKGVKIVKKQYVENVSLKLNDQVYIVNKQGISNEGMILAIGDSFKVLESDGEVILIEKIGDSNNPYFVSSELLEEISDYKK